MFRAPNLLWYHFGAGGWMEWFNICEFRPAALTQILTPMKFKHYNCVS
jgi:hypothetical protein